MQGMTKNPLALGAGVLIMLFGISFGCFFGYQFFIEEKVYRSNAKSVMGQLVEKEKDVRYSEALASKKEEQVKEEPPSEEKTSPSTESSAETTKTTEEAVATFYKLHYSFKPMGKTKAVTGVFESSERLFNSMKEGDSVEILYIPGKAEEDHRALFPIKFGKSFYAGVSVLLGGCLFIAYLGWCFIFPEDEPIIPSASENKKAKREKAPKKNK